MTLPGLHYLLISGPSPFLLDGYGQKTEERFLQRPHQPIYHRQVPSSFDQVARKLVPTLVPD